MSELLDADGNVIDENKESNQEQMTQERFEEVSKKAGELFQKNTINSYVAVHGIVNRLDNIVSAFMDNELKAACPDYTEEEMNLLKYSLGSYGSFIGSRIGSSRELLAYMLSTVIPFCNIICSNEDAGYIQFDTSFQDRMEKAAEEARAKAEKVEENAKDTED